MQRDWRKRHFGLFVVLAFVLALGALFQDYRFDRQLSETRASLAAAERSIGAVEVALSDLGGAQTGYLSAGQDSSMWTRRSAEALGLIETTLTKLREGSTDADARFRYEAATAALAGLVALDKKAREHVDNDQRLLAADVIYTDGPEAKDRFRTELAAARAAESVAADARITRLTVLRLATTAGAVGLVLLFAMIFGRPATQAAASEAATMAQMLRDLPPAVKGPPAPIKVAAPPVSTPPPTVPATPVPVLAAASVIDLPQAAELCVDLARVIDTRDVPALLERVASLLDAKGVIIWAVDSTGKTLSPVLTHGYPGKVLTRLGVLDVEADNVTSLSFRSMRPQMMPGGAIGAAGAIAVPLMTAAGCSGVLAAEIRESRPAPEMIAITRILAAQFATIVAPTDLSSTQVAQA